MQQKQTLLLIIATIAALALTVIALITSMKLREVATLPVTPVEIAQVVEPAVRESQPSPAVLALDTLCQTIFTVGSAPTCNSTCRNG